MSSVQATTEDDQDPSTTTVPPMVTVVGAGLAGCEAAYQLARHGVRVQLLEMRPSKRSAAHSTDGLAELVCSSSLRARALSNAVGLLKEELQRAGSLIMRCAASTEVPAGGALAVDRVAFSGAVEQAIGVEPRIELRRGEELGSLEGVPRPLVLATGPLTSDALATELAERVGTEHLAYYDAISPIVDAESIDFTVAWRQSRYDKGGADYLNCPLDEAGYRWLVGALRDAEKVAPRPFEQARYFEGCLPLEVMAERGEQTLAHGPLKPVGLTDPRTGRRPFAVLQLRAEDRAATAYGLVGGQTRMTQPEQRRVLRTIPGLEQARFLRYGAVHRNTFIDAPALLDDTMQLRACPGVYVAGQLSGVEGYVESAAGGLLCALLLADALAGRAPRPPPPTTALGGILTQLRRRPVRGPYQPSNLTWAHFPPLEGPRRRATKRERYARMAERALEDLSRWLAAVGTPEPGGGARTAAARR